MNILNYILIRCENGQQVTIPIQLEITEVVEIQAVLDGISSGFGDLGYALVKGSPTFTYSGNCEVTYYIDNEGVRVGSRGANVGVEPPPPLLKNYNLERLRFSDFEELADLIWQKNIAVESVLDVIDCGIGLGLRFEVQKVGALAMEWQDLGNGAAEYDLVIQLSENDTKTKVLFNTEVYTAAGNTQVSKVEMVVRIEA